MTVEMVLATNVVKFPLALIAAVWTLLLMREMRGDRRTLFWLFAAATELLATVGVSALWFGLQRMTVLGLVAGEPMPWRDSGVAAVLNVIFAHGCWLFILVSYRVWCARGHTGSDFMADMPRYAWRSAVAIVLLVLAVGLLLRLV